MKTMKQIRKKRSPKGISSCIYTCIGIDLDIYDWYCEQPNKTRLINILLRKRKDEENNRQMIIYFDETGTKKAHEQPGALTNI